MTEPAIIEAPLVLTLKCSDDRDAPWLVMRATNLQQLESMLHELEASSVPVDIGRVAATFQNKARVGAQLEARPLDPAVDGGSFDNVKAAVATAPAAPVTTQPATATPTAGAPAKFPSFGGFKTPPTAPVTVATPAPAATRPATEPPPAAPATGGFPAAPAWKKP
jgi:hypothetical protein